MACDGCPYSEYVIFESRLPEGGVHGDDQRKKIEAEISELRVREQCIREMCQLSEDRVRNYLTRKSV